MGVRVITKEIYDEMLEMFRQHHNVAYIAERVKSARVTVSKAFEVGWPNKGLPPIKQVIAEEQEQARAQRQRDLENQIREELLIKEQARKDAIEARAQEAKGAKITRTNALGMAAVSNRLLVSAEKIVKEIESRVATNLATLDLDDMRKLVDTTARMVQRAQTTMVLALQIERVVTGQPVAIIGHAVAHMTPEQLADEFEGMLRTAERSGWIKSLEPVSPIEGVDPNDNP